MHANMHTSNKWLIRLTSGRFLAMPWWKRRFISLMCVGLPCLIVALAVPGQSATVLSVTGATGKPAEAGSYWVAYWAWGGYSPSCCGCSVQCETKGPQWIAMLSLQCSMLLQAWP